jgi:TonB family protein
MTEERRTDAQSWAVSLGTHAALLLVLLGWPVLAPAPEAPKELEVSFVDLRLPVPAHQAIRIPRERTEHATRHTRTAPAPRTRAGSRIPGGTRAPVAGRPDLPAPPRHSRTGVPMDFRADAADSIVVPGVGLSAGDRSGTVPASATRRDEREATIPGSGRTPAATSHGGNSAPSITRDPGALSGTPGSSATIDWHEGPARQRIAGVLPVYPPGVEREAQIRVRFTVRPDGTVTDLAPVQKGVPRLEDAALSAVRTWRFTALPAGSARANQTATVTFTFRLR